MGVWGVGYVSVPPPPTGMFSLPVMDLGQNFIRQQEVWAGRWKEKYVYLINGGEREGPAEERWGGPAVFGVRFNMLKSVKITDASGVHLKGFQ